MTLNSKYFFLLLLLVLLSFAARGQEPRDAKATERYVNPRFCFSVLAPKQFQKKFSDNGDGIILTAPQNKNVEIRASGGYNALFYTLEEEASLHCEGEKILSHENINLSYKHKGRAIKAKKILSEANGQRFLKLVFSNNSNNDIFYSVWCQAPKSDFNKYQKLFEKVIQSIRLTQSESE